MGIMFTYSSTVIPLPLLVIYLPYHQFNLRKHSIYYFHLMSVWPRIVDDT